jgi:DNA-binding response OmpR family regulator
MIISKSRPVPEKAIETVRVLIVEDVRTVAVAMSASLQQFGMEVEIAVNGAQAVERKASFKPDVVLVDLELPDINGISLVERFAAEGDCGVIVVTANDVSAMRISGLDTGADDYIVKPAAPRELAARINALHRRMNKPASVRRLRIFVDPAQRCLIGQDGQRTLMTEAEMTALETLIDAAGSSVSREWLSRVALKRPLNSDDRAVDQLVMKIRRKIASLGASERVILSARRQGYVIAEPALFRMVQATVMDSPPIPN